MPKHIDVEEIELNISKKGFILLDYYKKHGKTTNNVVVMDSLGYKYDVYYYDILLGCIPNIVQPNNPFSLENIELWLSINNPLIELHQENVYTGKDDKLYFVCTTFGDNFYSSWNDIRNKKGCPYCSGNKANERNSLLTNFPELSKEWSSRNKIFPSEVTRGSSKKVWWTCKRCKHDWESTIVDRSNGHKGCPKCNETLGEKSVRVILEDIFSTEKEIREQVKFEKCVNITKLSFDFGLFDDCGVYALIEYQGEHHFRPVDFAGRGIEWATKKFESQQIKDQIKRDFCYDNNYQLIEVPYWLKEREIREIFLNMVL